MGSTLTGQQRNDQRDEEIDLSVLRNPRLLLTLAISADLIAVIMTVTDGIGIQGGSKVAAVFGLVAFLLGAGYLWLVRVRSALGKRIAWLAVVVGLVAAALGILPSLGSPEKSSNSAGPTTPTSSAAGTSTSSDSSPPDPPISNSPYEETMTTTTTVPSRPQVEVELGSLSPVAADFGYDATTVRMLGITYTQGVQYRATSSEERTVEYDLGGRFSGVAGLAGLDDETPNSNAVAHFKFIDERGAVLYKAEGKLGQPAKLDGLKLSGVLRLKIVYMVTDTRPHYYIERLNVTLAGVVLRPVAS